MRFSTIFTALFAAVAIAAPTPDDPISDALGEIVNTTLPNTNFLANSLQPGPFGEIASSISSANAELLGGLISLPRDIAGSVLGLPFEIASDVWGNLTPFSRKAFLQNYEAQQQAE
jgi:hypothetical protein